MSCPYFVRNRQRERLLNSAYFVNAYVNVRFEVLLKVLREKFWHCFVF